MKIKRSSMLTKIVLAVLLIYALVTLVTIADRTKDAEARLEEEKRVEAALAAENDGMMYDLEHKDDPDVIEGIARDKLGMTNPDEETFYADRKG